MSDRGIAQAAAELSAAEGDNLCAPFVHALPIDRAAISTLVAPFGAQTVCASDNEAARLDELQLDLGEGPCWTALATRQPAVQLDVRDGSMNPWPTFAKAIGEASVRMIAAVPLYVASLDIGAIDLYADRPGAMDDADIAAGALLAGLAATQVLRRALDRLDLVVDEHADDDRYSLRELHQATGMVVARLGVPSDDALVMIRAHAFAAGRSVRAIAHDIVQRTLDPDTR